MDASDADMSDDELKAAFDSYVNAPPTLADVVFKTPVGPVIIVNIVLAVLLSVQMEAVLIFLVVACRWKLFPLS